MTSDIVASKIGQICRALNPLFRLFVKINLMSKVKERYSGPTYHKGEISESGIRSGTAKLQSTRRHSSRLQRAIP